MQYHASSPASSSTAAWPSPVALLALGGCLLHACMIAMQCMGCGAEIWRFNNAGPSVNNCILKRMTSRPHWRAPNEYREAYQEWEHSSKGAASEPLCFDFRSPLPCEYHEHVSLHRSKTAQLGGLNWVKVGACE
jgi:hypothetical protein